MAHDLQPRKPALGLKIHPQSFLQSPRIRAIRSLPTVAGNPRLVYRPNHQLKAASKGPGQQAEIQEYSPQAARQGRPRIHLRTSKSCQVCGRFERRLVAVRL